MDDGSKRSYSNILLYPKFQRPILWIIFLTGGTSLLSLGTFIYVQTQLLISYAQKTGTSTRVYDFLLQYGLISGILFVLSVLLMSVWALFITHKLIGPISRIKRELDNMYHDKSIHLISLREDDYLRPLIQKYNRVLWGMSESSDWGEPDRVPKPKDEKD